MKALIPIGLLLLCSVQLGLGGFAQYGIILMHPAGLPADGALATTQTIDYPSSVVSDGMAGFYVASGTQNTVYRVTAGGQISRAAGSGINGFSGEGGPATSARLNLPFGVALDAAGNLYIADYLNNRIRKVTPAGIISTVAGNGSWGFSGDRGPATSAQLSGPRGVAVDAAGNFYISDYANHRIRKVTTDGVISTVAGNGTSGFSGDGGPATSAQLSYSNGVALDAAGNLYISDSNNNRIRMVTPAGIISTVAGNGNYGFSSDGGPAISTQLNLPRGVAVDATGNLYIADCGNNRIRRVTPAGIISTVAGNGTWGFSGDGGAATSAQLNLPFGVGFGAAGSLYIADSGNNRVRKVSPAGVISTVAGNGTSGFNRGSGSPTPVRLRR